MGKHDPRDRYLSDGLATASPARLLTMLFDRFALDLQIAQQAVTDGDLAVASERLIHAQDITMELQSSLDRNAWEGAAQLSQIYSYLLRRLIEANVQKDAAIVGECRSIVEPLRETWHEAARLQLAAQPVAASA